MNAPIKIYFYYVIKEIIAFFLFVPGLLFLKRKFSNGPILFILNYHNFSKYNNYKIKRGNIFETGYVTNFERQMKFLKKHFNFCYPNDFFSKPSKHNMNILITFDDGYKDNFDIARPILKKYNITTIFFVTTKYINGKSYLIHDIIKYLIQKGLISKDYLKISSELYLGENNYSNSDIENFHALFSKNLPNHRLMMNHSEVRELFNDGFEIGNHTSTHERLTFLNKEEQYQTIKIAENDLHNILGIGSNHIAYPNGLYNDITIEVLNRLNLKYGYSIIGGYNMKNCDLKSLKRIGVNPSDSICLVILKLFLYSTLKFGKI